MSVLSRISALFASQRSTEQAIVILVSCVWVMAVLATIGAAFIRAEVAAQLLDISLKLVLPSWGGIVAFYFGKDMINARTPPAIAAE